MPTLETIRSAVDLCAGTAPPATPSGPVDRNADGAAGRRNETLGEPVLTRLTRRIAIGLQRVEGGRIGEEVVRSMPWRCPPKVHETVRYRGCAEVIVSALEGPIW